MVSHGANVNGFLPGRDTGEGQPILVRFA